MSLHLPVFCQTSTRLVFRCYWCTLPISSASLVASHRRLVVVHFRRCDRSRRLPRCRRAAAVRRPVQQHCRRRSATIRPGRRIHHWLMGPAGTRRPLQLAARDGPRSLREPAAQRIPTSSASSPARAAMFRQLRAAGCRVADCLVADEKHPAGWGVVFRTVHGYKVTASQLLRTAEVRKLRAVARSHLSALF